MIDVLERSWETTKLTFRVMRQDPELLAFPALGGIFSALYVAALWVPSVFLLDLGAGASGQRSPLFYVIAFATYFGLAFVGTFFNVCTVFTTKVRLSGGDATLVQSLAFAVSRVGRIAAWSAVAATVGLLLRAAEKAAERSGGMGGLILDMTSAIVGVSWSVMTIFVVPVMVYRDVGPIDAIRGSSEVLSRTWGESLVRYVGLGLIQALCIFVGIGAGVGLLVLVGGTTWAVVTVVAVVGLYLLAVSLTFTVANTVFNTALFVYADTGQAPGEFERARLSDAIHTRR
ncbi:MAG: DUF6159 family protein [Myxococcales bacterium]|jgi:hypothetical protein